MRSRTLHLSLLISIVLAGLSLLLCSASLPAIEGTGEMSLIEVTGERVSLELRPAGGAGLLEAELCALDGKLLAKATRRHAGKPVRIDLYAQVNKNDLAGYYVRYRFAEAEAFQQRSLFFTGEVLETIVLGQREFVAGTQPVVRLIVRDRATGRPVDQAEVSVELVSGDRVLSKVGTQTNAKGEVAAQVEIPDIVMQNARLRIHVKSKTAEDAIEEPITVRSALRTLLTTDKPLYQPGQTIHIRALTLSQPGMKPLAEGEVVFEVEDAKGNKVFKVRQNTDKFGISHADFVLADELNMGRYKVRAIAAGAAEEKTVTVERYVLPKFKVSFRSDRDYYLPGETVKGEVQADYFFGKPVAGGKVAITCSKFDVAYVDFQSIEGKTDAAGHYAFEVRLPEQFVGQPLEAGKASAKFEISVIDTADHKETVVKNLSVSASPIVIAAVPESGELVPGLENKIYIVTTYADAKPASCKVTWGNPPDGGKKMVTTDEAGFAEIALTPGEGSAPEISLTAEDAKGHRGQAKVQLKTREAVGDDSILVRTDKSLRRVGDTVSVTVISTRRTGTAYLDLIKDRQTYLSRALELKDGKATTSISLDALLAGTVQINAYVIGKNGVIVRDRRIILVDPADDLKIKVASDSETYTPGAQAKLRIQVTDRDGRGTPSALGVIVVDEAVFALQEMQPGLEKVYFYLEKEIATPRYEIHGYELDGLITPSTLEDEARPVAGRRESAARVLLASAKGAGDYTLYVNTYSRDGKGQVFQQKMIGQLMPRHQKIAEALGKFSERHHRRFQEHFKQGIGLDVLVQEGYLKAGDIVDPWGNPLRITGQWSERDQAYVSLDLASPGIDGRWDTADDVVMPGQQFFGPMGGMGGVMRRRGDFVMLEAAPQAAVPGRELLEMDKKMVLSDESSPRSSGEAAEPIRIRQYFPETLYFNPVVITDGAGLATLDILLADSITTWRMSCMASSLAGQLGSTTAGIRVFQDFFVDIDFPVALTQNDEIHVPVAIYNYLKTEQTIELQVEKEDWFELQGLATKTVTLAPSEVRAVQFPIIARKVGFHKFTVTARGSQKSDAVARSVEVTPDGKEYLLTESGRLEGRISHKIIIPQEAIDDAGKIFVKIYPGVLSQAAEGLEQMLRMPGGCFEQTSSVTYPNVLVLDYMKTSGKITPELQMKAEGFINAGYQRLVSFEVPGGGFEWFGKAPAQRILTAYGLMEFHDMSKVHEVDPAIIARTQQWLAKGQESDGSYKPAEGGIREGAINRFTDDVLRNTAYVTWALASTGYSGPEVRKGVDYLHKHLNDVKDTYTLALTANTLAAVDPEDDDALSLLKRLFEKRKEDNDVVYWPAESETAMHGTGAAGDIEVTGLAVQAFIRCGRELGTVSKAITYLVKNKDAYGTWQSTQATIQALRAMLMAERGATAKANATVKVSINDTMVSEIKIDAGNSDVLQLVDLKEHTRKGESTVTLDFAGEGALLYQIVGRYYLPHIKEVSAVEKGPLNIDVDYDRTQLAAEDIITVTATVSNNRPSRAKMVIVDLALPPGFTLVSDKLDRLVEDKTIEKYSTTGRQIIVYLREIAQGKPVRIGYQLRAKYPLKAKTGKAVVYEYYDPEVRAEAAPTQLLVTN